MSLVLAQHPAAQPGASRLLFLSGWTLRQASTIAAAAAVVAVAAAGLGIAAQLSLALVAACVCVRTAGTMLIREAWTRVDREPRPNPATPRIVRQAPLWATVGALIVEQGSLLWIIMVLTHGSTTENLGGMLFASGLVGIAVAGSVAHFPRATTSGRWMLMTRIPISAVLMAISIPPVLASNAGPEVPSVVTVLVLVTIVIAGALAYVLEKRVAR